MVCTTHRRGRRTGRGCSAQDNSTLKKHSGKNKVSDIDKDKDNNKDNNKDKDKDKGNGKDKELRRGS